MAKQKISTREALEAAVKEEALLQKFDRMIWLLEGPDNYDVINETIPGNAANEIKKDYSPYLIWGVSLVNKEALGGNSLNVRFTTGIGLVRQFEVIANSTFNLDLKGGKLGSLMSLIANTGTVALAGFVLLKYPSGYNPLEDEIEA